MRAAFLLTTILLALSGCLPTELKPATIPASVVITPPDQSVPARYAAFSGVWAGTWGNNLDGKLAVQTISADGIVTAVYAWGDHRTHRFKAGSGPVGGSIANGVLRLYTLRNGATVAYQLRDDGGLDGTYTLEGVKTVGRFVKR